MSRDIRKDWKEWKSYLSILGEITVNRCFKPSNFNSVKEVTLHHFSDASEESYGQVSYLRLVDTENKTHCVFVMGKSRVAPLKFVSIPRLELTAATLSVKMSKLIREELQYSIDKEYFWTDSQVVLGYLQNESKRFKVFVANKIQIIKEHSDADQWQYVASKDNPADHPSRGIIGNKRYKIDQWFNGPSFLWKDTNEWPPSEKIPEVDSNNDPEIKRVAVVNMVDQNQDILSILESRVSSWVEMKRVRALVMLFKSKLLSKISERKTYLNSGRNGLIDVQMMEQAKRLIIRMVQRRSFRTEIETIRSNGKNQYIKRESPLYRLDPFIAEDGIIRVGGRLKRSAYNENLLHPIVLPKDAIISKKILEWCHIGVGHSGRGVTLYQLRSSDFWIICGNSVTKSIFNKCVICRSLRGKVGTQKMAELPRRRVTDSPPFTYYGVDMFGPFIIKEGRKELKRYGAMFTCLASRAVHIEITNSMETDSFILALRRFIARRGNVRSITSDNGTNFVGAHNELKKAFSEMNHQQIQHYLTNTGADWLICSRNVPAVSHMGGVWERHIRSARSILALLLKNHGTCLKDESLHTLMTEVETVINSGPRTVETINDPQSLTPLSPSNLLTMKSRVIMPPPGSFFRPDLYNKRQWRRVQHLANEFWSRWRKEFLSTLRARSKWTIKKRNFKINDIVLIQTNAT